MEKDNKSNKKPINNEINKQNKSYEIKRPPFSFNINNKFSGLNTALPYNNELRSLANAKTNFNDSIFKSYLQINYPIQNVNNMYNFQNQYIPNYISYNPQVFGVRNIATNAPILKNNLYNNRIFNSNNINDNSVFGISKKILNTEENAFNNSSMNDFNYIL